MKYEAYVNIQTTSKWGDRILVPDIEAKSDKEAERIAELDARVIFDTRYGDNEEDTEIESVEVTVHKIGD